MLSQLPAEILYDIASYLRTFTALRNFSITCRRIYGILSTGNWVVFRAFIQHCFPGIDGPPHWRDVAQALTTRSRAVDRNAVIGRFVVPSGRLTRLGVQQATRLDNPTRGYCPPVDSYEVWNGEKWQDRRELVVWGAAHQLVLGIKQLGSDQEDKWFVFNDLENTSSHDDVCGLHLLRPGHYAKEDNKEHLIFSRVRGNLVHIAINPDNGTFEHKQRFATNNTGIEHIDLSDGPESVLAAHFIDGTVRFFPTTSQEEAVEPFADIKIGKETVARNKCSRFLSSGRFALATGRLEDALVTSTVTPQSVTPDHSIGAEGMDLDDQAALAPKTSVSAIAPMRFPFAGGAPDNTFLSAWGDNVVRLHDLRSDKPYEAAYRDITDSNPVYSVHSFTHDKFAVGAGGDAVLKIFDFRMHRKYDFFESRTPAQINPNHRPLPPPGVTRGVKPPEQDLTMFLSSARPYTPGISNPRRRDFRPYHGPIYNMSSPSLLSPTIYAGVEDAVMRLDFMSTDDLTGRCAPWYEDLINLDVMDECNPKTPDHLLNLSGYLRPDPENTTYTPALRTQQHVRHVDPNDVAMESATGWDRRWDQTMPGAWRRGMHSS